MELYPTINCNHSAVVKVNFGHYKFQSQFVSETPTLNNTIEHSMLPSSCPSSPTPRKVKLPSQFQRVFNHIGNEELYPQVRSRLGATQNNR